MVFLACPGRLRQIRLAIHAGLDGDPPIRIIDRRYESVPLRLRLLRLGVPNPEALQQLAALRVEVLGRDEAQLSDQIAGSTV